MAQNQVRDAITHTLYELIKHTRAEGLETADRSRLIAHLYRCIILVEQVVWTPNEPSHLPNQPEPTDSSQAV